MIIDFYFNLNRQLVIETIAKIQLACQYLQEVEYVIGGGQPRSTHSPLIPKKGEHCINREIPGQEEFNMYHPDSSVNNLNSLAYPELFRFSVKLRSPCWIRSTLVFNN